MIRKLCKSMFMFIKSRHKCILKKEKCVSSREFTYRAVMLIKLLYLMQKIIIFGISRTPAFKSPAFTKLSFREAQLSRSLALKTKVAILYEKWEIEVKISYEEWKTTTHFSSLKSDFTHMLLSAAFYQQKNRSGLVVRYFRWANNSVVRILIFWRNFSYFEHPKLKSRDVRKQFLIIK